MGCAGSSAIDGEAVDEAGGVGDEPAAAAPLPVADSRRAVHSQALSTIASLEDATNKCRAAVEAVIGALGGDNDERYTDPFWSPLEDANKMLYLDGKEGAFECTVSKPARWQRLSAMTDSPVLISDRIRAIDVRQGSIGDCHLLSAIASVAAANRSLLQKLFVHYDIKKGVFGVLLFVNGAWSYVLVDDWIAVDEEGAPLYARCASSNEVWLPVLEKAIAKAFCCFENLDGGKVAWALEVLTGMHIHMHIHIYIYTYIYAWCGLIYTQQSLDGGIHMSQGIHTHRGIRTRPCAGGMADPRDQEHLTYSLTYLLTYFFTSDLLPAGGMADPRDLLLVEDTEAAAAWRQVRGKR